MTQVRIIYSLIFDGIGGRRYKTDTRLAYYSAIGIQLCHYEKCIFVVVYCYICRCILVI